MGAEQKTLRMKSGKIQAIETNVVDLTHANTKGKQTGGVRNKIGRRKKHKKKQHKTKWSCFIHPVKHFSSTPRQKVCALEFMNACPMLLLFSLVVFAEVLLFVQFTVPVFIAIVITPFSSSYCLATKSLLLLLFRSVRIPVFISFIHCR